MRKTRKRAWRAPSPGWDYAHARLEDRLLLSGTPATSAEVVPHGSVIPSSPNPAGFLIADASSPQAASVVDGGGNTAPVPPTVITYTPPPTTPSTISLGPSVGPSAPVLGLETELTDGPFSPGLIGDPVGPRAEGIESTVLRPMENYYLSYSPLGEAAMGILPTDAGASCASMESIVGVSEVELADLASPPGVPQPMAMTIGPRIPSAGTEAVPVDEAGAPAALDGKDEPAPAGDVPAAEPPTEAPPASEPPPAPIAAGLRLSAPPVDVAGWDEALNRLVEGVDDLAIGIGDLGASPATLPWVVAAGLMLIASEAARRARPRPRLAAAFVDGSASVVDPADDPSDRPRALPLGSSVRRLVALGLSRWTTRR
jgi:hypothetical protein